MATSKPSSFARRARRAPVLVACIAVLGAACGQVGGVHQQTLAALGTAVAAGAEGPAPGDDIGLRREDHFSADPTTAPAKPGTKIVKTITTTTTTINTATGVPVVPQFTLTVNLNATGPLYTCPVQGHFTVGDDFGAPRYAGGYHPHAGNDMFAAEGTPIVAPFDGIAENVANSLGGNAVKVWGVDGYVYNAHLSAYGRLGRVKAGEVIGYVGNSGDAQGTSYHDHFEWHPYHPTIQWVSPYGLTIIDSGDPPAVDPYPYLHQACTSSAPPA
jgi:murein DD-endopeptidase MepM/ murein hydrolase activator NlpD